MTTPDICSPISLRDPLRRSRGAVKGGRGSASRAGDVDCTAEGHVVGGWFGIVAGRKDAMTDRRALVIGVGRFASMVAEDDEPPGDVAVRPELKFVYSLIPELEQALRALGYEVSAALDPDRVALRQAIDETFADGCRVVHLISHGEAPVNGDPTRLHVVPACGRTGRDTNVSEWVAAAQELDQPMLFLLDLCRAGTVARLPFLIQLAGLHTKAWVIAASGVDEYAYDGRFSSAVVNVLRRVARNGLETHPTRRYVAFSVVAWHVGRELAAMPGYEQRVHATPLDPAFEEPELPFFPNPRYVDDPRRQEVQRIDALLRAFLDDLDNAREGLLGELDEGLDARHFLDRVGMDFVGRRRQLRHLASWLDGSEPGGLRVVTGNPGVGKSALLGALVCAAHPVINQVLPSVRARLQAQDPAGCPSPNPTLVAIHARQRTQQELLSSLARQLDLPMPLQGWRSDQLIDAIEALPEAPSLVFDALDEALDSVRTMRDLLIPLTLARRRDGQPVCRLIIGVRPWPEFAPLRELAAADRGVIDLDKDVSDVELRADLEGHLLSRLARLPGYRTPAQRLVRERLAVAVAGHLAGPVFGRREWGVFLVAGIFVRYLGAVPAVETVEDAVALGAVVPRTLPDVLELDLAVRAEGTALRSVLAALSHAEGSGMPAELAGPLSAGFGGPADPDDIEALLTAGRFYLRTDADRDGTTLYRLFHQGLADYLRQHPLGSYQKPA
jgi:hypothetical protein